MKRMTECWYCKYCESEYVPYCTKHKIHVHAEYDGCTFGTEKMTNETKFEKTFGISFHEFIVGLKREDQLTWGISEYKEPPCED